jgi:SAM-dependent methyltransferase
VASNEWESQAENWLRWARTPGHDAYWYFRNGFFDHIVPPPGRATLELGCGEGRVARDLSARGHHVVGLDRAPTLLAAAKSADPDGTYLVAEAAELPFPARTFDVVVAYNSLMDIADMPGAVREVGRVLRPGGTFSVSVTHPVNDVGHFVDASTFVIEDSYLEAHRFEGSFERDGLTMTFFGWTHPLRDYAGALEGAGLHITRLREPLPDGADDSYGPWRRLPMFLQLRAVKPGID